MKNKIYNIFIINSLIYFVFALFSCNSFTLVNDVPLDKLPNLDSKIVLNCYIAPQDSIVMVNVTQSRSLYSTDSISQTIYYISDGDTIYINSSKIVADASVELSNGTKSIKIPFDSAYQLFTFHPSESTMLIEAGKTYTLTVQVGNKKVKASTIVPSEVPPIDLVGIDTATQTNRFGPSFLQIKAAMQWKDLPQPNSYYRVFGTTKVDYLDNEGNKISPENSANYLGFNFNPKLFNDIGYEGKDLPKVTGNCNLYNFKFENGEVVKNEYTIKPVSVLLSLLSVDEHYYKFHKSLENYVDSNPFSEPTPVYTNVEGGLGCFGSSNRTFVFKEL